MATNTGSSPTCKDVPRVAVRALEAGKLQIVRSQDASLEQERAAIDQ